jgi:hypothetical protein
MAGAIAGHQAPNATADDAASGQRPDRHIALLRVVRNGTCNA